MPNGLILGIDDEFFHDQGAYVRTHGGAGPGSAGRHAARPLPRSGLSRARPFPPDQQDAGGTYRAPGRYESTFVRERLIDAIADRLGLDAIDGRAGAT